MRGENGRVRLLVFNVYTYIYIYRIVLFNLVDPIFFTKMGLGVTEFNRPYQIKNRLGPLL